MTTKNNIYHAHPLRLSSFREAASKAGLSPISRSYLAAFQVMIKGRPVMDAAKRQGINRAAVYEAIARIRTSLESQNACPHCGQPMQVEQ